MSTNSHRQYGKAFLEQIEREQAYLETWTPFYHPVATVQEVDSVPLDEMNRQPPLGVELLGHRLVLARLNGEIVAMDGTCPHRGMGLHVGWVNEGCSAVTCRYHGFEWGHNGRIAAIPSLEVEGRNLPVGEQWQVPTYPTVIRGGLVWVSLSANPKFPVIDIPEENDPDFVGIGIGEQIWDAGIGRMEEAAIDNYHFFATHVKSGLGHPSNPHAPKVETNKTEDGYLTFNYMIDQPVNITTSSPERISEGGLEPVHYQLWVRPNAARLVKTSSIGKFVIAVGLGGIAPEKTKFYRLVYRNFRKDDNASIWFEKEDQINAEDQLIVSTGRPWTLSTDLDKELQAVMDRPTVTYRQWLEEMGIEFA